MEIQVTCPQCGKTYNVEGGFLGQRVVCKACKHSFIAEANQGLELTNEAPQQPLSNKVSPPSPPAKSSSSTKTVLAIVLGGCLTIVVIGVIGFLLLVKGCKQAVNEFGNEIAREQEKSAQNAKSAQLSTIKREDLVEDFKTGSKTTKIQQEKIFKDKFSNKKVQWEITVYDITSLFNTITIQSKSSDGLTVYVNLNASEKEKALKYKEDDKITVEGVISDYSLLGITLNYGRIISDNTKKEEKQLTPAGATQAPKAEDIKEKPETKATTN